MSDRTQAQATPRLIETPEEVEYELRATEGATVDRHPAAHRGRGLRLRLAGFCILLLEVFQQ